MARADRGSLSPGRTPERADITEDRPGVPLRLGLRLLAAQAGLPLAGVLLEVWHADHEGRYSGFQPFHAQPGQVVTSESVRREIVAPGETFLRGAPRTDERGVCAFRTIYPGWYSSRTAHIHLRAHLGERTATTQLYFPDEVTDRVFTPSRRTQVGRGATPRTTTTASSPKKVAETQSSTWWAARRPATPVSSASLSLPTRPEVASTEEMTETIEAHVAAVGAADADAVASLQWRLSLVLGGRMPQSY